MKALLFATLGTLALATWASASVISFSATIPTQVPGNIFAFNLTKFDTNLGFLTGVTLELDPTGAAVATVINFTGSPTAFTNASAAFPFTLTGPDGTFVQVSLKAGPFSGIAPNGSSNFNGTSVSGAFTTNVSNLNLANYEGTGVQPLALTAGIGSVGTFGGSGTGLFFGGNASAGGTARVTYSFVPEPGTLALLGSALLGLGAISRRLRKAK